MPLSACEGISEAGLVCSKREQKRFSARHEGGVSSRPRSDPASEGATWLRSGNCALACDADPARHRRARWPREMRGSLENFRQTFHNFRNRRGTFFRVVRCPMGVRPSANGRLLCAGNIFCRLRRLLAPPVREGSRRVALPKPIGNQKSLVRVEIVFLGFLQREVLNM